MPGASVPGGTTNLLPIRARPADPAAVPPAGGGGAALFWVVAHFLFYLPALAPLAAFLFASFWFASGILLGVGTISIGWLGVIAAMLAFDCLPEGALKEGPFGLIRRIPPNLTGAAAVRELGLALLLDFYLLYSAIFWVFALAFAAIAARLFLF